jgi:3-dehydroquinate synthetase
VGGKTGINLAAGKNLVGSFHQPAAGCSTPTPTCWPQLPPREFAAGMAEVIKHGHHRRRRPLRPALEQNAPLAWDHRAPAGALTRRCVGDQGGLVVAGDERETSAQGGRAPLLNLGDTFGHAVEATAAAADCLHRRRPRRDRAGDGRRAFRRTRSTARPPRPRTGRKPR